MATLPTIYVVKLHSSQNFLRTTADIPSICQGQCLEVLLGHMPITQLRDGDLLGQSDARLIRKRLALGEE
jgi:hypothetical protein